MESQPPSKTDVAQRCPVEWVEAMAEAGADQYTFHIEATDEPKALARKIREAGMKAGVGVKPDTPIEAVLPVVEEVDMVLVMTVEPGFGGQAFRADMMPKVELLRRRFPELDIEVDGGVGLATIDACAKAGANMIVSGSAVVQADDPRAVISQLRQSVVKAL
ncbi:Ribulose-phosphate 3-epimerase [Chionoecetes opilio]|uniref:ribulose-phosphate 3-epimerase n=1 Tax=Chionoecetes opilio TaxID=41210 RepID=A0A8J4YEZ7_CHIOP|nr:Ribulose-phosphate 3-epimerase [Chionoecetes opilio]